MTDRKIQVSNSELKRQARTASSNQRSFGGKLTDFTDNRDRHFNQRMLKAYFRGDTQFQFGQSLKKNHLGILVMTADWHPVVLTDKTVDSNALDKLLADGYTDPGKVFGGVGLSKSKLRKLTFKREIERLKALKKED